MDVGLFLDLITQMNYLFEKRERTQLSVDDINNER